MDDGSEKHSVYWMLFLFSLISSIHFLSENPPLKMSPLPFLNCFKNDSLKQQEHLV